MAREVCPGCGKFTLLPVLYGMPLPEDGLDPDVITWGCIVPAVMLDDAVACEDGCGWSGGLLDGVRVGSMRMSLIDELLMLEEHRDMVPHDDVRRMSIEITLGWGWQDSRTHIPDTIEHRAAWDRMTKQVADIKAHGNIVEIPND